MHMFEQKIGCWGGNTNLVLSKTALDNEGRVNATKKGFIGLFVCMHLYSSNLALVYYFL